MAHLEDASAEYLVICYSLGTQFTGFTGTNVQILTQKALLARRPPYGSGSDERTALHSALLFQ